MTEPEEDSFLTTQHIDIPPDLSDQIGLTRNGASRAGARRSKVIRIARTGPATRQLGDADFQELLQSIYDAVLITDLQGQVVSANVRAVQFFLSDAEELCRHNVLDLVSGADPSLLSTIRQTLQSDRFVLIQAYCARKDGSIFPAEISVNRLPLSGKDYLSFFIRDVTLRKETEDKLRTGYNAILNAGSGIAITDAAAILQYCNPSFVRLWRLARAEDMLGRSLRDFLPDVGRVDEIIRAVASGETWSSEVAIHRPDGTVVHTQVSAAPNFDSDGEFAGIILSLLDISNLKAAQQQLEAYAQELQEKNLQMEEDLHMAREVQFAFLPQECPGFPVGTPPAEMPLRFNHLYLPSGLIGGDFFDIITISESKVGVFIADVVGHGMRAALVVATIRGLIEQSAHRAGDPGAFLEQLNKAYATIFRQTSDRMFATAFYFTLDVRDGSVAYSCAGHLAPFLLRRGAGSVEVLAPQGAVQGAALGLFGNSTYASDCCRLNPDDIILLYTDGLSEAMNDRNEYFETARLPACLARNLREEPSRMLGELVADARRFSGREEFEDDVCLLAAQFVRRAG